MIIIKGLFVWELYNYFMLKEWNKMIRDIWLDKISHKVQKQFVATLETKISSIIWEVFKEILR